MSGRFASVALRVTVTCATAAVFLLLATAGPALAFAARTAQLKVSGAVEFQWRGDPTSCAAAGVCGVTGSLTYRPGRRADLELIGPDQRSLLPEFGGIIESEPPVVRVRREGSSAECVDLVDADFADFSFVHLQGGRVRLRLGLNELSAGRCAGPRPGDLARVMPSAIFGRRSLRQGSELDLSGTTSFTAGPFTGEVTSTIKMDVARVGRSQFADTFGGAPSEDSGARTPGRGSQRDLVRLRLAALEFGYRVAPLQAGLTWEMHGLSDPDCRALASCHTGGSITYELNHHAGLVSVGVARVLGNRERSTRQRELAALHAGRRFFVGVEHTFTEGAARVSQQLATAEGATCRDTRPTSLTPLHFGGNRKLIVALRRPQGQEEGGGVEDPLRTRCPGPAMLDVLGRRPLARAAVEPRALGRGDMRLALGPATPFAAGGYTGAARGELVVEMRHVRTRFRVFDVMVPRSVRAQFSP